MTGRTKQRDERWTCFRCRERARVASIGYSVVELADLTGVEAANLRAVSAASGLLAETLGLD